MFKKRIYLKVGLYPRILLLTTFLFLCWLSYFICPFFSFLFFIPIFITLSSRDNRGKQFSLLSLFFVFNFVASYWLIQVDFWTGILIHSLNALGMYLTSLMASYLARKLKGDSVLFFLSFWLLFEQLHNIWSLSWPWLSLGNILASSRVVSQFYDIVGELGGTCFILVLNFLIFRTLKKESSINAKKKSLFLALLIFVLVFVYGKIRLIKTDYSNTETVSIKALIPNIAYNHIGKIDEKVIDSLFFKKKEFNKNSVLILPENSLINDIWLNALHDSKSVNIVEKNLKKVKAKGCIFGTVVRSELKIEGALLNKFNKNFNVYYSEFGASIYTDTLKQSQVHLKRRLVPKEEYLPSYLNNFEFKSSFLSHGNDYKNIRIDSISLINLICYESCFSEDVAKCVDGKQQAILMIANQQMFPYKYADDFYTNICRLRAIENKKYFLKISNKGTSCLINPTGDIIDTAENKIFEIFHTKLPLVSGKTFYAAYSFWIHMIYLFQPALLTLIFFLRQRKNKVPI